MLRLELIGISKRYPAVKANDNELARQTRRDPRRARRERAGKSTMMKMIYGAVKPRRGEIRWNSQPVQIASRPRRSNSA